jgi:hypothetical protein
VIVRHFNTHLQLVYECFVYSDFETIVHCEFLPQVEWKRDPGCDSQACRVDSSARVLRAQSWQRTRLDYLRLHCVNTQGEIDTLHSCRGRGICLNLHRYGNSSWCMPKIENAWIVAPTSLNPQSNLQAVGLPYASRTAARYSSAIVVQPRL